jgi:hypothetical protein
VVIILFLFLELKKKQKNKKKSLEFVTEYDSLLAFDGGNSTGVALCRGDKCSRK